MFFLNTSVLTVIQFWLWKWENLHHLDQLVGVLTEHLCILLDFFLIAIFGSFNQDKQGNVGLQERVRDMVHYSFAQLWKRKFKGKLKLLYSVQTIICWSDFFWAPFPLHANQWPVRSYRGYVQNHDINKTDLSAKVSGLLSHSVNGCVQSITSIFSSSLKYKQRKKMWLIYAVTCITSIYLSVRYSLVFISRLGCYENVHSLILSKRADRTSILSYIYIYIYPKMFF